MASTALNNAPQKDDACHFLVEWILLGILAGTPFVYLSVAADPSGLPRMFFLQMGAGLMFGVLLIKGIPLSAFLRSWPQGLFFLYLIFAGLSIFWANDQHSALSAFLELLTCGLLFLSVSTCGVSLPRVMRAATIAGGLVSILGLLQIYGVETPFYSHHTGSAATFINKNVAAQYLAGLTPLSILLIFTETRRPLAWLQTGLASLMTAYLLGTESRAAVLSVLAAIYVLCLAALAFKPLRSLLHLHRRKDLGISLFLYLLLVILLNPHHLGVFQKLAGSIPIPMILSGFAALMIGGFAIYGVTRMDRKFLPHLAASTLLIIGGLFLTAPWWLVKIGTTEGTSEYLQEMNPDKHVNTALVRVALYKNGLQMVVDQPFKGVGLGNFRSAYPLYHNRIMPTPTYAMHVIPERMHNDFFQNLAELGLIGGALFFLFFFSLIRECLKLLSNKETALLGLGPFMVILAIAVFGLFSFPLLMPSSRMLFWVMAGMLISSKVEGRSRPLWRHLAFGGNLLLNITLVIFYAKWLFSSILIMEGRRCMEARKPALAYAYTAHAHKVQPLDRLSLDQMLTIAGQWLSDREAASLVAEKFLERESNSPNGYYRYAFILKTQKRYVDALNAIDRAIELAEYDPAGHYMQGMIYWDMARVVSARKCFEKALELDPNYEPAKKSLNALTSK